MQHWIRRNSNCYALVCQLHLSYADNAPAAIVGLFGRKEYEQCAMDLYYFLQVIWETSYSGYTEVLATSCHCWSLILQTPLKAWSLFPLPPIKQKVFFPCFDFPFNSCTQMQQRLWDVEYVAIFPFAIPYFGLLSVLLFFESVCLTMKFFDKYLSGNRERMFIF